MASKRKRLTPRTARPDYSWVHGIVGALIAMLGVVVIVVVTFLSAPRARAEQTNPDLQQWFYELLWPRRNVPVPLPTPRPQTEAPAPTPAPPPPVVEIVPEPAPPVVEATPAPVPAPPPPKIDAEPLPKIVDRPHPKPRIKRQPREDDGDHDRPRPRVRKPAPQTDSGFCFFPVTCAYVCERARAGDNRRGTACQNARGLACIRSTCPEVLKRR